MMQHIPCCGNLVNTHNESSADSNCQKRTWCVAIIFQLPIQKWNTMVFTEQDFLRLATMETRQANMNCTFTGLFGMNLGTVGQLWILLCSQGNLPHKSTQNTSFGVLCSSRFVAQKAQWLPHSTLPSALTGWRHGTWHTSCMMCHLWVMQPQMDVAHCPKCWTNNDRECFAAHLFALRSTHPKDKCMTMAACARWPLTALTLWLMSQSLSARSGTRRNLKAQACNARLEFAFRWNGFVGGMDHSHVVSGQTWRHQERSSLRDCALEKGWWLIDCALEKGWWQTKDAAVHGSMSSHKKSLHQITFPHWKEWWLLKEPNVRQQTERLRSLDVHKRNGGIPNNDTTLPLELWQTSSSQPSWKKDWHIKWCEMIKNALTMDDSATWWSTLD